MFSFFKKGRREKEAEINAYAPKDFSFLGCDMHSHLIPGIDDGSKTIEESLELIRNFKEKGYSKLITTPHVQLEFYDNRRDTITEHFIKLKERIVEEQLDVELAVAAEYYLDNFFLSAIIGEGLLTFGDNYVLVEVSMAGWPRNFSDAIFEIQSLGYKPILAHPERYLYEENPATYMALKKKGVLFQMNMLSVLGYYGKGVKTLAERYMAEGIYDFCGSDTHNIRHLQHMEKLRIEHPSIMLKLYQYGFKNIELLQG